MSKKHILFVDDEPNILQGLKRMLRPMRNEWEIETIDSGQGALDRLGQEPFDVIVSDMRMPGMDGATLLHEVMQRYPQIVRIVLSGQSDQESIYRSVGPTHQYLSKPCDAETLKITVDRALSLRNLLSNDKLRRLTSQLQTLPSMPTLYSEVLKELHSEEPSIARIGRIISQDAAMTAKLLQLVNSAFFGFFNEVTDSVRAINILGLDKIRSLVLSIHIFSTMTNDNMHQFNLSALWKHNLLVGQCSKEIASSLSKNEQFLEEAYMAGLLHDTGKLIFMANLPEQFNDVMKKSKQSNQTLEQCETETFGASHAEIGAYLLGLWGLPTPIVEAVAYHHHPELCSNPAMAPLTTVHVANALIRELLPLENEIPVPLQENYIQSLVMEEQLSRWRDICEKTITKGEDL